MQVESSNPPTLHTLFHPPPAVDYSDVFADLFSNGQSPQSIQSSPLVPNTPFDPLFAEPSMFTSGASPSSSSTGGGQSEFFNFMGSNDLRKVDPFGLSNFDFASALNGVQQQQLPSPASSSITIDPASILNTPTSVSLDDFEGVEESSASAVVPPVKAGGHGKGARKGTVQSGGVTKTRAPVKKASPVPVTPIHPKQEHDDEDDIPADWRPSPEVLAKMTSKEKRQLRNKISARNFRVRRKEYITTLEGDVAERDKLLSAIRSELGTTQSENQALRAEIAALKRALLSGSAPTPSLLQQSDIPASLPSPATTATSSPELEMKQQFTPPSSPLVKKDVPIAGPSAPRAFWAGGATPAGTAASGFTSVHRMVLPELNLERAFHNQQQEEGTENINPLMSTVREKFLAERAKASMEQAKDKDGKAGFDQWSESNLFSLKNMDAYRMHLWQQMATRQQQQQHHTSPSPAAATPLTGLASGLVPHGIFGGRSIPTSSSPLTPPATPPQAHRKLSLNPTSSPLSSSSAVPSASQQQDAILATLASQTVVRKLGSAFWDAFKGKEDGVSKVLSGKAKLVVVDVPPPPTTTPSSPSVGVAAAAAVVRMPSTTMGRCVATTTRRRDHPECSITAILEESMRSLSLAGKKV
ncbi:hypothetical protein DL96DRAFT_1529703 [Flagelloscypha sp. PMI_526]|nr:hypothetical protein DL96DRAFT_1529703 [Flagelloscypha sp. PMI_526]